LTVDVYPSNLIVVFYFLTDFTVLKIWYSLGWSTGSPWL